MSFPNDVTKQDGGAVTRPLPFNKNTAPVVPAQPITNYSGMAAQAYSAPASTMTAGGKVYDTSAPTAPAPGTVSYTAPATTAPIGNTYAPHQGGHNFKPFCKHFGPHWKHGETTIIADKIVEIDRRSDLALIIDCSEGDPKHYAEPELILPAGFETLAQHYAPTPRIQIPWPDYGTPRLPAAFWQELVDLLPAGKVAVGCVGGHGRTGSALVALRMVIWGESFLDALTATRKDYCADAVETMGQRVYLRDLGIALGTTRPGTAAAEPISSAAHVTRGYKTIGEEIAAELRHGAVAQSGSQSYDDWRAERDAGYDVGSSAMERGARISKKQMKRLRKKREMEARKLAQAAARTGGTSYSARLMQADAAEVADALADAAAEYADILAEEEAEQAAMAAHEAAFDAEFAAEKEATPKLVAGMA
jgi:hypothetical protein